MFFPKAKATANVSVIFFSITQEGAVLRYSIEYKMNIVYVVTLHCTFTSEE